jgi:hypothetical protein
MSDRWLLKYLELIKAIHAFQEMLEAQHEYSGLLVSPPSSTVVDSV